MHRLRFDAPVDVVDGVSRVEDIELAVEDVEFQRELPNRRVIEILHEQESHADPRRGSGCLRFCSFANLRFQVKSFNHTLSIAEESALSKRFLFSDR